MSDRSWITIFCLLGSATLLFFLTRSNPSDIALWQGVAEYFGTSVFIILPLAMVVVAVLAWHGIWLIATRKKE